MILYCGLILALEISDIFFGSCNFFPLPVFAECGCLDRFNGVFELDDGMLAVVEVSERLPGGFIEGVADPLDEVVGHVVDAAALEYLLDFPLGVLGVHYGNRENIRLPIALSHYYITIK